MSTSDAENYIATMPADQFSSIFDAIVHTEPFSAIASMARDSTACGQLRNMFYDAGLPRELFDTEQELVALVRAITGRWLSLRDR